MAHVKSPLRNFVESAPVGNWLINRGVLCTEVVQFEILLDNRVGIWATLKIAVKKSDIFADVNCTEVFSFASQLPVLLLKNKYESPVPLYNIYDKFVISTFAAKSLTLLAVIDCILSLVIVLFYILLAFIELS